MKLQRLLSLTRQAVNDYNMIEEGDRIAVGVSGGKDSLCLLIALAEMRRFFPKHYEIEAITVSLGLEGANYSSVEKLCERLGVHYTIVETQIGRIIFDERKEKNPCSLCAKMRKGALNNAADELGCNKVALGHNKDDVIETFMMSLIFEGRISCFSPVSFLERKQLSSIRPLIYVSEYETKSFIKLQGIETVKNPCPADGNTKREEIKELLLSLNKTYPNLNQRILGALSRSLDDWKRSDENG
ncbi:MAG: tRNA 2-thiocytidine biosynthesis TtcA family protein [Clostridiales bacterium]|nr:tRNA 2-thiocytidine biosynthesis TtcA family protein [Clostridiales bacterium]